MGSGPEQGLSMGCRKGEGPQMHTQGHRVSGAQPLDGGKAERGIILGRHLSGEQSFHTVESGLGTGCDF